MSGFPWAHSTFTPFSEVRGPSFQGLVNVVGLHNQRGERKHRHLVYVRIIVSQ